MPFPSSPLVLTSTSRLRYDKRILEQGVFLDYLPISENTDVLTPRYQVEFLSVNRGEAFRSRYAVDPDHGVRRYFGPTSNRRWRRRILCTSILVGSDCFGDGLGFNTMLRSLSSSMGCGDHSYMRYTTS